MFAPFRVFFAAGALFVLVGAAPIVRFLWLYAAGSGGGHIQSLILGGAAVVVGFLLLMIGIVADLIACNRQLIEMVLEKVRRMEIRQERLISEWEEIAGSAFRGEHGSGVRQAGRESVASLTSVTASTDTPELR